jgi:molybdate transport system permease protein
MGQTYFFVKNIFCEHYYFLFPSFSDIIRYINHSYIDDSLNEITLGLMKLDILALLSPIKLSLQVAFISIMIVSIIGTLVAKVMVQKKFSGKVAIETLLLLPLVLPPTVIGFLLVFLFGGNSWLGKIFEFIFHSSLMFSWWAAVIASSVVAFPLMYQSAKTGFQMIDKDIEDAARVDGASEWLIFLKVTLPLSYKALIAGIILSFARALGEFGATLMFAGNIPGKTQTAPTAIYVALESGNLKEAWILVFTMILISFVILLLTTKLNRK